MEYFEVNKLYVKWLEISINFALFSFISIINEETFIYNINPSSKINNLNEIDKFTVLIYQ